MGVTPTAVLSLAGQDIASGPGPDGSWPGPMALDGAAVKWGRTDVLAQPTPATATAAVFDPSGTWAATANLVGQPLTLRWTWAGESHAYFRGRVASVTVTPHTARRPDGAVVAGARVELSATSVLVDLANRRPTDPTVPWPAETFAVRRARVTGQAAGPVNQVTIRPVWDAAPLAAVDTPGDAKVLEHLETLLGNAGADRWTFDPDTQTITWIARRSFDPAGAARLARDPAGRGVYVTGPAVTRSPGEPAEPAVTIPAAVVGYDGGASRDMASRITRVTLTYPGTGRGFTVLTPNTDEALLGVRSLDVQTQHTDDTMALAAANDLSALVTGEASGWALEPMRWTTGAAGFGTVEQARLLLAGSERSGVFWLAGSWLPALGVTPLFGVMGGSITCRRGAWTVDWTVAPTATTAPVQGFSFDDLDPSIVWTDADDPNGWHASVTLDDLAMVGTPTLTNGA
jgi:hypothetical protein